MTDDPLGQIERSWRANAPAWIEAVREGRIASRRLATDDAVVEAVMAHAPRRVLDLGCGEGWLARTLAARGVEAVGVDGSAPLVEAARRAGGGTFHLCGYAGLAEAGPARFGGVFDVVAANFALLGEPLDDALAGARGLLSASGVLVIQTVHPWTARGDAPYRDGWRMERFDGFEDGFGERFAEPMPWFFRTLRLWFATLARAGFRVDAVREPAHPDTGEPVSLILEARARAYAKRGREDERRPGGEGSAARAPHPRRADRPSVLVTQAACYQRWDRMYQQARIDTGPVGLIRAAPGDRVVFERRRFIHYPMPFAVAGEKFMWEVADERVREGEVIRLPDPAVRAEYQPIGHPAGRAYRDVRGTITVVRVGERDVLVDVQVASNAAGWRHSRRIRYARRPIPRRY